MGFARWSAVEVQSLLYTAPKCNSKSITNRQGKQMH